MINLHPASVQIIKTHFLYIMFPGNMIASFLHNATSGFMRLEAINSNIIIC